MWQRRDTYQQHLYNNVLVKRTRVLVRNREIRMWSLVAKKNIPPGTFIGFYTGCMASRTCPPGSHYALQIGPSQPCIVPFPDESEITPAQREFHALANMNEPIEGEYANCHMAVQDFSASEIENVAAIQGHARFYRAMACFACERIDAGEALTWNYGTAFEPIRQLMNYNVGQPCRRVLENEVFIQPASQSVLQALGPRIPHYCVYPVLGTQHIKSARFKVRRRHATDSEGEQSDSFSSGSDAAQEAYRPRLSTRRQQARHEAEGPCPP